MLPLSVIVVVTGSFLLIGLMPGDPAVSLAGPYPSEERVAAIRDQLGLDHSFAERYFTYLNHLVHFDLGNSFFTGVPVTNELGRFLPATVELLIFSFVIAAVLGIAIGTWSAYRATRWGGKVGRALTNLLQSIPDFLLGLVLIYLIFYRFHLAPAPVGRVSLLENPPQHITGLFTLDSLLHGSLSGFWSALRHLALPSLAVGLVYSSYFARITNGTMMEALASTQVEYARACGLSEWRVLRYAFLVARAPVITYGAILFGALVGGVAIVETVFAWPGAGQWALTAILRLDIPVIQGFIVMLGVLTVVIYLLLDVVVALLDPRVSYE